MTTLMQAVARAREASAPRLHVYGDVSVRQLRAQYPTTSGGPGSLRSLIAAMNSDAAVAAPFAIMLSRFAGEPPHPLESQVETFIRQAFTTGTGGFVEYWRDASLGSIDVAASQVFGWRAVGMPRSKAGGAPNTQPAGPGRLGLTDAAIKAVQRDGGDPLTGFGHHQEGAQ